MASHGGQSFSTFKGELVDAAVATLAPIAGEMRRLLADPGHVDGILRVGAEKAAAIAEPILAEVYRLIGLHRV